MEKHELGKTDFEGRWLIVPTALLWVTEPSY
jgi:hypothetical protein